MILIVLFDHRSQLGLVRLRVKKASVELAKTFEQLVARTWGGPGRRGAR